MSSTTPSPVPSSLPKGAAFWGHLRRFQSLFALLFIFVVAAANSPVRKGANIFLGTENLLNILRFASESGIIAIGMTLVILTGGIDLSVGAVLGLCAVGAATAMTHMGLNLAQTVAMVLGIGLLAGLTSGLVTTGLRIQSFVATLAMLSVARGVASRWADGKAIPLAYGSSAGQAPPLFKQLFAGEVALPGITIPVPIFYFLVIGVLTAWVLQRTTFGRHIYAVGSNEAATRLSGVPVGRIKVIVFVLSGLLVGLASLLHAALVNQGAPNDGAGYELTAIAAVVIGGTSLAGGSGAIAGTMGGTLILQILDNILGLRNVPSEYQAILKGVIIVLAVVIQREGFGKWSFKRR